MAPQLTLINVALTRIGANQITSLEDDTEEQRAAVALWDVVRRATIRDGTWSWATREVGLAPLVSNDSLRFQYSFQLPSDCLRVMEVYDTYNYKLVGRHIHSDGSTCKLRYIADVTDTTEWDPSFDDVMAQRLAAELAFALTKSQATADSMWVLYDRKLRTARHQDSMEEVQDPFDLTSNSIISERW